MEDSYLIPANSKKSQLILGFFTKLDLVVFLLGIGFTMIMLFLIDSNKLLILMLILSPALISAFLVMPVPYYHNIRQLITNIYNFIFGQNRYYWKGWCIRSGDTK